MRRIAAVCSLFLALVGFLAAARAEAAPPLDVRPSRGRAPAELVRHGMTYRAEIVVRNAGESSTHVTVAMHDGPRDDPRLPIGTSAVFAGGRTGATLAPGAAEKVLVTWTPAQGSRLRELYGHVVVTGADGEEAALGVPAERGSATPWLSSHVLSWLLGLPMLGALLLLVAPLRHDRGRGSRRLALGITSAQLALGVWLVAGFRGDVSRLDGNDGFQLIERAPLIPRFGVEYSLGVDGLSVGLVVLVALSSFVACLVATATGRRFWTLLLVADAGLVGAYAFLDSALLVGSWLLASVAFVLLLAGEGGPGARRAAAKLAVHAALSTGLVLFVLSYLATHAGTTFASDGTATTWTLSIPELVRSDFLASGLRIAGANAVAVLSASLIVAVVAAGPIPPLHTWLGDALASAPRGANVLLAAAWSSVGVYLLLRVGYCVLPAGLIWASTTLACLGVFAVVYGAVGGLARRDLHRLTASASVCHIGFALLGIASLTSAGVEACVAQLESHGVAAAAMLWVAGAVRDRAGSTAGPGGPALAAVAAVAFAASVGVPGTSGFIGTLLCVVGALPMHPAVALLAVVGWMILGGAHLRALPAVFPRGTSARSHPTGPGWVAAPVALAVAIVLGGVAPRIVLRLVDGSAVDSAAFVNPAGPLQISRTLAGPPVQKKS